jgi:aspartate aminotransferase
MIAKQTSDDIKKSSAIRAMFIEGKAMAKEFGAENVFDFSLGNPMVPVPEAYTKALHDIITEEGSLELHGYMDNSGYIEVRATIAKHLNGRFQTDFSEKNIVMTVGAAGAVNVILKTLFDPGDELVVFAPFFSEYRGYCKNWQGELTIVQPDYETFQPDFKDLERKITPRTKAVLINNPVNPTGVLYTEATVKQITAILKKKQEEYKSEIYLISDEPYRELVYDGKTTPFLTQYYNNTFIVYSFSKSLSIPGDRIGYIALPNEMSDFDTVLSGLVLSNRVIGFVNAPALMQKAVARCLDEKVDLSYYDRNRKLIYESLLKFGFSCIKPEGTFYLFIKSPDAEEQKFVAAAKKYHILLVSGTAFACPGYVRLAYCVSYEMLTRSLTAFSELAKDYRLI